MSKKMMIAFVEQMIAMAKDGKTAVERLKYVPAGVKDGVVYAHDGFKWGEIEMQDCEWIGEAEVKKSRLTDSKFVDYLNTFKKCAGEAEEVFPDKEPETEPETEEEEACDECDAEILLDIQEAVDDGDIEDAEEIMKELKSKDSIAKAKKIIAGDKVDDEDEVTDEDLIDELQTIIDELSEKEWTGHDIADAEDVIDDIEDKKLKVKAKKMLEEALAIPEVEDEDDLTEEEAIEEIKLAIEDGDKEDAQELLKFIKDARQLRRYTRKVKGM
jgi:hypothetical protein